jgi:integration host factor subunit beta
MRMTKRGIIEELLTRHQRFTYRESETIVNAMFDEMAKALASGARIEVRGFGSFGVKKRRARQGRNPKTGVAVKVDAKRVPFFRAGKELKLEVNGAQSSKTRARAAR